MKECTLRVLFQSFPYGGSVFDVMPDLFGRILLQPPVSGIKSIIM
jgi:hypothetical protein